MAGESGKQEPDLIDELLQSPAEFEFFQAVRLIERAALVLSGSQPLNRIGSNEGPQNEAIRFRALPSLTFPAGQISAVTRQKQATQRAGDAAESAEGPDSRTWTPLEMTIPFMGLTGPAGVLPEHYTSLVIERSHLRTKDHALREFFDLFNHRVVSLFYRAWEKYRFPFAYERRQQEGSLEDDLFTLCLFCLVGMGGRSLREHLAFDDQAVLYFGGLFASRSRTAVSLQQMLEAYFRFRAEVIQFRGQWLYLPEETQTAMPSVRRRTGLNLALGQTAVAGARVWDVQSRIRVRIGPLDWTQFSGLLPGTAGLACVADLIRLYLDVNTDAEVQLILRRQEVPSCRLSSDVHYRPQLGWNTWIGSDPDGRQDAGDAVFCI